MWRNRMLYKESKDVYSDTLRKEKAHTLGSLRDIVWKTVALLDGTQMAEVKKSLGIYSPSCPHSWES